MTTSLDINVVRDSLAEIWEINLRDGTLCGECWFVDHTKEISRAAIGMGVKRCRCVWDNLGYQVEVLFLSRIHNTDCLEVITGRAKSEFCSSF